MTKGPAVRHSKFLIRHSSFPKAPCCSAARTTPADTVRPRLDALGADPGRVTLAGCVTDKTDRRRDGVKAVRRTYDLAADLPRLRAKLDADAAAGKPVGLVVVDPLAAFVPRTNRNHEGATRLVLDPLAALARETGAAVVAVIHLRKDRSGPAVLGPLGVDRPGRRRPQRAAVRRGPGRRRRVGVDAGEGEPGRAGGGDPVPRRRRGGGVFAAADEGAGAGEESAGSSRWSGSGTTWPTARGWRGDAMRDGLAAGICRSTLKLARRDLGLRKHRFRDPDGVDARGRATGALWVWALPGQDPAAAVPGHLRGAGGVAAAAFTARSVSAGRGGRPRGPSLTLRAMIRVGPPRPGSPFDARLRRHARPAGRAGVGAGGR